MGTEGLTNDFIEDLGESKSIKSTEYREEEEEGWVVSLLLKCICIKGETESWDSPASPSGEARGILPLTSYEGYSSRGVASPPARRSGRRRCWNSRAPSAGVDELVEE